MKTKVSEAHFRMSTSLPSTIHQFQPKKGTGHPNVATPVKMAGVRYESITEAAEKLGFSTSKMYRLLDRGFAEYVK